MAPTHCDLEHVEYSIFCPLNLIEVYLLCDFTYSISDIIADEGSIRFVIDDFGNVWPPDICLFNTF